MRRSASAAGCGRRSGIGETDARGRRRSAAAPAASASATRSRRSSARPVPLGRRAHRADRLVAGQHGVRRPRARSRRARPARCGCARCRDAACATPPPGRHSSPCRNRRRQPVHVGLVREGVAVDEIEPAARHAERDAVRLVGGAVDEVGADQLGDLLRRVFGHQDAPAERRRAAGRRRRGRASCAGSPSQAASTPRLSERSSTVTLARSL